MRLVASPASLAGRLMLAALAFTALALAVAGLIIALVLGRFIRGQVDSRLDTQILFVASAIDIGPDGRLHMPRRVDGPPFDRAGSGWAWQASGPGFGARSTSLDTGGLVLDGLAPLPPDFSDDDPGPPPREPGQGSPPPPLHLDAFAPAEPPRPADGTGRRGEPLHGRLQRFDTPIGEVTVAAAAPAEAVAGPVRAALIPVSLCLAVLGLALAAAALLQIRIGLRPVAAMTTALAAVRRGERDGVPIEQPSELQPFARELNALLAHNVEGLERARRHVANLAHGLKTPLATLTLALSRGERDPGGELGGLAADMQRQIAHHLRRARMAALGGPARSRTELASRLADLVMVLARVHAGRELAVTLPELDGLAVACEPQDVDEMLGNLLDNAFKWARGRVCVRLEDGGRLVGISIDDDGPGLTEDQLPDALLPGRRLDEAMPGHGFGLSITRELAELYGGSLALERSPLGGLLALVRLPVAPR